MELYHQTNVILGETTYHVIVYKNENIIPRAMVEADYYIRATSKPYIWDASLNCRSHKPEEWPDRLSNAIYWLVDNMAMVRDRFYCVDFITKPDDTAEDLVAYRIVAADITKLYK